jgi:hypothetical protein
MGNWERQKNKFPGGNKTTRECVRTQEIIIIVIIHTNHGCYYRDRLFVKNDIMTKLPG